MRLSNMFLSALCASLFLLLALNPSLQAASMDADEFAQAKQLMDAQTSCQDLSEEQLEQIGDYVMEQMAPGAAHVQMEQLLGGEESASLLQAHLFMAHRWYCGDAAGYGMMSMMTGGFGPSMMGSTSTGFPTSLSAMMGNGYGYNMTGWMLLFSLLSIAFLGSGIAAFVKYLAQKK